MPTSIERDDVQRLMREGAQLVEVLPPAMYEETHLPGAINIPLTDLNRDTTARLERDRPLIVY